MDFTMSVLLVSLFVEHMDQDTASREHFNLEITLAPLITLAKIAFFLLTIGVEFFAIYVMDFLFCIKFSY